MTNWKGVEDALRPYTDHEVRHAQRLIWRQLDSISSTSITSPIGLLVREARIDGSEYFDAPPPVEDLIIEDTGLLPAAAPPPTIDIADHGAQIAVARQHLAAAKTTREDRDGR